MKNKSIEYYYPKATNYLSAAIEVNGKYLILRNTNDEIFNALGYYFPGCKQNKDYDDVLYLKEQIRLKYGLIITVNSFIGDVLVKDHNKKYSCLYLYKCSLISKPALTSSNAKALFCPIEKFKTLHFDTADGLLAQRMDVFKRILTVDFDKPQRTKEENVIALKFYSSLLYFGRRVAKQDVLDFQSLLRTSASFDEVKRAYDWICSRSNVDMKEYESYLTKEKGKK